MDKVKIFFGDVIGVLKIALSPDEFEKVLDRIKKIKQPQAGKHRESRSSL